MELEEEYSQSLRNIVSILPGKVHISITKQPNALPLIWEDPELDASMSHGVVAFAWFPPFATAEFRKCGFIELDTSFKALRPYTYAIRLGIRANEAMPLGIIIGPSESRELYDRFFTGLIDMSVTEDEIGEKSFPSDQHPALVAVCPERRHFLCRRHILESFGRNSFLSRIAHRLAFCLWTLIGGIEGRLFCESVEENLRVFTNLELNGFTDHHK
jgi:hypothetical protein